MNVSTKSTIYRFLKHHIGRDSAKTIPQNLCPYMRRFVWVICVEASVIFVALFFIQCLLWAPVQLLYGFHIEPNTYLEYLTIVGRALWCVSIGAALLLSGFYWFDESGSGRALINRAAQQAMRQIQKNIFYQWYKAVHDRICPNLYFLK